MALVPVTLHRCTDCLRLYEEKPGKCVCERHVYIDGERFGPFIVEGRSKIPEHIRVRCILCDTLCDVRYTNIKKQQSCGCKARSAEVLELNEEILVYRCRKCEQVRTVRLPVVSYCCEEENEDD